jgi:hypothetical protein
VKGRGINSAELSSLKKVMPQPQVEDPSLEEWACAAHYGHHMNFSNILFKLILPASFILFFNCHQVLAEVHSVKKVYNGSTIKLKDGKKIKYIGVDTPGKGKPFYDICKKANKSLVDKKKISIETDVLKKQGDGKLL